MSDGEASVLKKQCLDELRHSVAPTRLPRAIQPLPKLKHFSLRPPLPLGVTATTLQSPTSALAKLNFNQPSPTRTPDNWQWSTGVATIIATETSPTIPLRQFPTTSLDKLSFVPCFTKEEHARRTAVSTLPAVVKSTTGKKRPISIAVTDRQTRDQLFSCASATSKLGSRGKQSEHAGQQVTLRSPETKRLVRPNSIAFSSYPRFEPDAIMSAVPQTLDQAGGSSNKCTATTTAAVVVTKPSCVDGHGCGSPIVTQAPIRHSESSGSIGAPHNFEKGRKSRSLEDILNSPDDQSSVVECTAPMHHRPYPRHIASDIFPPSLALDKHCCGDPHQSSSSISSGGSHSSLHGSLEFIQVS